MKRLLFSLSLVATVASCHPSALVLYNTRGNQRVYPHFIDQPMVLAFWRPDSIECIDDMAALNALTRREGSVYVMGVCSSDDQVRANKWMRKEGVRYEVISDPELRLARRLGVSSYPTYVLFDRRGRQVDRRTDVRTIHNWFDRDRWRERLEAP